MRLRSTGISALLGLAILVSSYPAFALTSATSASLCFQKAAEKFHVDPLLLHAIAEVETGVRNDIVHVNRDGSKDYGLMQVNEINLSAAQEARITADPCFAVEKGAEVLSGMIARFGYSWAAVGGYNAGLAKSRAARRHHYAAKVSARYQVLVEQRRSQKAGGS
jgi:soluble lytic murein transglycosylase-like protein